MQKSLSIRDLQRVSGETIAELDGATPVTSGERTIAILIPLRKANIERLKATLTRAERLARGRDRAADDAALEAFGPLEKGDWPLAVAKPKRTKRKR